MSEKLWRLVIVGCLVAGLWMLHQHGRYQLVSVSELLSVQFDTHTGQTRLLVVGPEEEVQRRAGLLNTMRIYEIRDRR